MEHSNKYKELLVSFQDGLQVIKFNRPLKKNAISPLLYVEIKQALDEAAADDRVVITALTGEGDYYSSGNDISGNLQDAMEGNLEEKLKQSTVMLRKFITAFIDFPKILVAVVNGPAIGIAVTTLALCDAVYASDKATFLTPFTSLGLVAEACSSYTFPRIMGNGPATEVLAFNKKIDAYQAKQYGLVTEVFPDSKLKEIWPTLLEYAKFSPTSLRKTKYLMRLNERDFLIRALEAELTELEERRVSPESFEAVMKFMQKGKSNKRNKL